MVNSAIFLDHFTIFTGAVRAKISIFFIKKVKEQGAS